MEGNEKILPGRVMGIDRMKGLLVWQMILAHGLQFFTRQRMVTDCISHYVNLSTFSSFMFCFGYTCYMAYIRKGKRTPKILLGAAKCYGAYLISGAAFLLLVTRTPGKILKMLIWQEMPGYSEFLLSFVMLYVVVYLCFPLWEKILEHKGWLFLTMVLTLGYCLLPYQNITLTPVATLLGSNAWCTFPIPSYLGYFLLGAWMAKGQRQITPAGGSIAVLGTAVFTLYCVLQGELPKRFPPEPLWILGGAAIVCLYYFVFCSGKIRFRKDKDLLAVTGRHSLVFLVVSNVIIFFLWYLFPVKH
jgi:hypothetical protein